MRLVTHDVEDYEFLDWKKQVVTTAPAGADYAAHNSYVGKRAKIGKGAYLENSFILDESCVGSGSVISGVKLPVNFGSMPPANTASSGFNWE